MTRIPPWALTLAAMASVQLGLALSVNLIEIVGPAGLAWLRLIISSAIFVPLGARAFRRIRRSDLLPVIGLGLVTAVMMIGFMHAIERIPLGTAVAIEFLGPITVAAITSRSWRLAIWPALAMVGVVMLTEPWQGATDMIGVLFAALAGAGWGAYVLLTQRVGDRFSGVSGLAISIPIAAIATTPFGLPQVIGTLTPTTLLWAAGLALLVPTIPFILEMLALRRMTSTAFGTLMSLEPAFGVVFGLVVLSQMPSWVQGIGVCVVVLAGVCAQRNGKRDPVLGVSTETGPITVQ